MSELATLRIYQPARWVSAEVTTVIDLDGREFTRLRNGHSWASRVAPGPHILRARGMTHTPMPAYGPQTGSGRRVRLTTTIVGEKGKTT